MPEDYPKRDRNYKLIKRQMAKKASFAAGLPNTLIIEPGAVCSLKCPFCPQNSPDFDFSRELLTLDNFRRIVDYFEEVVDTVMPFNWGEPLLNPELPEMIGYASAKKMCTVLHSNCNNLDKKTADALVAGGLCEFVASIDGASSETYGQYRKGGSFELAISNLKLLCERKRRSWSEKPNIVWKFLVFKHNEHEMDLARQIAGELGIKVDFQFAVAPGEFSSTIEQYSNDNYKEKFLKYYGLPCEQLWRAPTIHADGTILPCCMVSQKKFSVGNFFRDDFKSVWNGERYRLLRDVASGRAKNSVELPCYNCMFGKNSDGTMTA